MDKTTKYMYCPGFSDRADPNMVSGHPLRWGAIVTVLSINDTKSVAKVSDGKGNVQIVWLATLVPAKGMSMKMRRSQHD